MEFAVFDLIAAGGADDGCAFPACCVLGRDGQRRRYLRHSIQFSVFGRHAERCISPPVFLDTE